MYYIYDVTFSVAVSNHTVFLQNVAQKNSKTIKKSHDW